ncbi:hypothetical protein F2Q70_00039799 [Brassica cretica]|uniref:3-hydroxyacyl-CoA dehydrogenase NAD binding domain-containing protein n=1 Tax=Brassica cretica TaxID=69181 RepID=A0A8S9K784_BRACR|nr:hypothetical protein F2Q70_00039799 [Brassica cretica]
MILLSKSISSEEGHKLGLIDALEAESFKQLVLSDTAKALVHVFFAQRATSKVPKVTDVGLKPRPMKKVAVIGGGLMGSGIATALLLSNIRVVLKEINSEYLLKGIKSVEVSLKQLEYPFIPCTMRTASDFGSECIWIPVQSCFDSISSCGFVINIVETVDTVTTITVCSGRKALTIPDASES